MQLVKNTAVDCSVWSQRYRNQTRLSTNFKKDVIMINSIWQGRPCKTVKAKILPGPNANGKRSSLVFVEGTVRYTKQKPGVKVNVWSLPIWLMMVKVSLDLIGICGMTQSAQRPIILRQPGHHHCIKTGASSEGWICQNLMVREFRSTSF
jgi:hypothetical protein